MAGRCALGSRANCHRHAFGGVHPLENLSLIVVDEEHDASYNSRKGFAYSARDLAVLRAQRAQSRDFRIGHAVARDARQRRAGPLLAARAPATSGAARPRRQHLVDLRKHSSDQGLSQPAMSAMERHLADGGQVIVFLTAGIRADPVLPMPAAGSPAALTAMHA